MKPNIIWILLQHVVPWGCVGLLAVGLWFIFGASIVNMFKEVQRYRQLEKTVSATKKKSQGIIFNHIYKALTATLSKEISDLGTYSFIIGSISLFIFSFLTALKLFNFIISLGIAIVISASPYVLLRLKLRSVQIEGSYDANVLVPSITNEYKHHYFNMINAVENCAVREDIGSYSRKNLFRLSLALKSYYSEEDLDKAIERFVFAYNTEWAVLLGLNIKMSIHKGIAVSSGLEDILKKLKDSSEQVEVSKRYNTDAFAIKFLLIPLYIGGILFSISTFGFTLRKYFEYQFLNPVGLRTGIISFMGIIVSFIALRMIRKPKYDI